LEKKKNPAIIAKNNYFAKNLPKNNLYQNGKTINNINLANIARKSFNF